MGFNPILDTMVTTTLIVAALISISECFPNFQYQNMRDFATNKGRLNSLVEQYYANIDKVDMFTAKGRSDIMGLESDGMVRETRKQAERLITILRKLANNPTATKYLKKTFQAGDCVRSVEEAIAAIESGTSIIENAEQELAALTATVSNIDEDSEIIDVTKASATILRQLTTLMPKLVPVNQDICGSTFDV